MNTVTRNARHGAIGPVSVLAPYLKDENSAIGCSAAQALRAIGGDEAAAFLVEALMDEDPDVRTDAMSALIGCARPEDAEAIRRSLMGDPVIEVKTFAIQALSALNDRDSIPLFRQLVLDRNEEDIAWEDGGGAWDDWLDIQLEAIRALGALGAEEAVPDILEARTDEMGQDLDVVAFTALAALSNTGVSALADFLKDEDTRTCQRAARVLQETQISLPEATLAEFARDERDELRHLAVEALPDGHPLLADLAENDPEPSLRALALRRIVEMRPDLLGAALADPSEAVQAAALQGLVNGGWTSNIDLSANVEAWLATGGPEIATVAAEVLPGLTGASGHDALRDAALDTERPLDVRLASIRSMGEIGSKRAMGTLEELVRDPVQQVRAAALAELATAAKSGPAKIRRLAENTLARAIYGGLYSESGTDEEPPLEEGPDAAASKLDAPNQTENGSSQFHITPDGEIVEEAPDQAPPEDFPMSTIMAIQSEAQTTLMKEAPSPEAGRDTVPRGKKGRRRRVPVDGPNNYAADIRRVALRVASDCPWKEIGTAIETCLTDPAPLVRQTAFEVLADRTATIAHSEEAVETLLQALGDENAVIRGFAVQAVRQGFDNAGEYLKPLVTDADGLVRAYALEAVAQDDPGCALEALADSTSVVRQSAIACVMEHGAPADISACLEICIDSGRHELLSAALRLDTTLVEPVLEKLRSATLSPTQVHTALTALSKI